ncbi:MAG TPA: hypothetical protein VI911_05185 [Patescibacteria group bacterium]|nr:hypothetical protein [Patescibacteria group bacterium]
MSSKSIIMLGMVTGSIIGGYIPTIFGVTFLSMWSLFGSFIGGILGIWITYKLVI